MPPIHIAQQARSRREQEVTGVMHVDDSAMYHAQGRVHGILGRQTRREQEGASIGRAASVFPSSSRAKTLTPPPALWPIRNTGLSAWLAW